MRRQRSVAPAFLHSRPPLAALAAVILGHSGHWAGGAVASLVIVGLAVTVWVRERSNEDGSD